MSRFEREWCEARVDAHVTAMNGLLEAVERLVRDSPGERFYKQAIEYLTKLRSSCDLARADEQEGFNRALAAMKQRYGSRSDVSFGRFLDEHGPEPLVVRGNPGSAKPKEEDLSVEDALLEAD